MANGDLLLGVCGGEVRVELVQFRNVGLALRQPYHALLVDLSLLGSLHFVSSLPSLNCQL